ncbi:hypothetical protein G9466_00025 [Halorussus sp. JP-T4]|nr:hypothetical protein [Halorussus sp. JP-T4]
MNAEGRVEADYTAEEIDAYAVYSSETDAVYWVPIEETGNGEMRLRVEEPHSKAPESRLHWADEYRMSERFE